VAGRRDIDRLQSEIEELFADLWQVPRFSGLHRGYRPAVDCFRSGDPPQLTVVIEVAGADPEKLQVVASGRTLFVAGERRRARAEHAQFNRMEIEFGPFQRRIELDVDVDVEQARATYDRGLLTVVLPIAQRKPAHERFAIEVTRG